LPRSPERVRRAQRSRSRLRSGLERALAGQEDCLIFVVPLPCCNVNPIVRSVKRPEQRDALDFPPSNSRPWRKAEDVRVRGASVFWMKRWPLRTVCRQRGSIAEFDGFLFRTAHRYAVAVQAFSRAAERLHLVRGDFVNSAFGES